MGEQLDAFSAENESNKQKIITAVSEAVDLVVQRKIEAGVSVPPKHWEANIFAEISNQLGSDFKLPESARTVISKYIAETMSMENLDKEAIGREIAAIVVGS